MSLQLTEEKTGSSWREQTLNSISAPPLPLTAFFTLFIALMYFTNYSEYRETVERSKMGFRLSLILLPFLVILAATMATLRHRWWRYTVDEPSPVREGAAEEWSLPWGLLLVVVLVLVLLHYQP